MERKMEMINDRLKEIEKLESNLEEMEKIAVERNAFPINEVGKMKSELAKLESVMNTVAQRGGSLEWSEVPMIGQASKDSARLQEEVKEYLGERDKDDVSSWEITQEYRDMVQIGNVAF